jgi:hypothetical protein
LILMDIHVRAIPSPAGPAREVRDREKPALKSASL